MTRNRPFEGVDDCIIEGSFRKGHLLDVEAFTALGPVIFGCSRGLYHTVEEVCRAVE